MTQLDFIKDLPGNLISRKTILLIEGGRKSKEETMYLPLGNKARGKLFKITQERKIFKEVRCMKKYL